MSFFEYKEVRIDKTFRELQDDILDEYNKGNISKSEMENILVWCEKMKKILKKK